MCMQLIFGVKEFSSMACIDENFLPRIFFSRIFLTMNFSQTTVVCVNKENIVNSLFINYEIVNILCNLAKLTQLLSLSSVKK